MKTPISKEQSSPGASRKDAYAADYAELKSPSGTNRHLRGDDPRESSNNSVTPSLAQPRYKA